MIFLSVSALLTLLLLVLVSEVLLPFVLAIVIAYVLAPLVTWGQKKLRLPGGLTIVLVYTLVLGTLSLMIIGLSPRLYEETVRLAREGPALIRDAAKKYGPSIESGVNAYLADPGAPKRTKSPRPALVVEPREDGSFSVELGRGVDIVQDSESRWRIVPHEEVPQGGFRVAELASQGIDRFIAYVQMNALEVLKLGQVIVGGLTRFIFLFFMVLMVAGYMMHTRVAILEFFRSLAPPRYRSDWDFLLRRVDRGLSGVVRGQLLICLVNGVLSAIGFWLFDLRYWPILSLVAGALSIIPVFGAILSSIPAVAIALTQSASTAVWVLLWIIGIHQVEANLLNPKIIGAAAKIHPVLVVFALLVGEHYFGLWGALLAVPTLSLVQSIFNHFRFTALPDSGPDSLSAAELARVSRGRRA